MPTQEERLSALEKFQKVAAAHIRETEENTTILLGVLRDQGRDIRRLVEHWETMDERLNTLESRLDTLERHMESRFETQEKKLDQVLHLLTTLTAKPDREA